VFGDRTQRRMFGLVYKGVSDKERRRLRREELLV
jgi:hypothetical protein